MSLSNKTVMIQIQKSILDRLMSDVERGIRQPDELIRFLAVEDVYINWDVYERLTRIAPVRAGLVNQPVISLDFHNPKPSMRVTSKAELKNFIRQMARYFIVKLIRPVLERVIKIDQKVSIVTTLDVAIGQKERK